MRNCCHFLVAVMLVAGASLVACSDDESSSSSPLQPSPLAPAPAGIGPGGPSASPVSLTADAGDVPGLSRVAPSPAGFNAYDARIAYRDGEVTITFDPVDMPRMPDAAREYRNRAVTVWQCPVEPHHVSQTCGEPVFWDSFAFSGSPSRTFALAECAGWLVVEAAELSADRYGGWRNAPLSCRTDEEGRTVADVDTGGGGAGWEDSRFDPPVRGGPPAPPVITNPGDQSTMQGDAVTFPVAVTSGDVTVSGLPPGLTWSPETGMVSGTVSLGAEVQAYPVTVTADDGVNDAVTETFTIMVMYHTRFLYDANGPYTFLRVSGTTVDRIHIAFLMLDRAVCPTTGTNVRYGGVGRLRGSGTTVLEFRWNNIGPAPWVRGSSYARITNPDGPGADLSVYRFRGGPARIASEVFPSMAFDLISPVKDPQGLAPPTKTREAVPPYAPGASGQTYYVTDSVDLTLTIDATTPGFTLPTDGTYCLVEMATCSATGSVFCA